MEMSQNVQMSGKLLGFFFLRGTDTTEETGEDISIEKVTAMLMRNANWEQRFRRPQAAEDQQQPAGDVTSPSVT